MDYLDLNWLTESVAVGADLDVGTMRGSCLEAAELGITHVVDARGELDYLTRKHCRNAWKRVGISHYHVPASDSIGVQRDSFFHTAIGVGHLAKRTGGKVFYHCHMGINRGPSYALAALISVYKMEPKAAFDLIKKSRNIAYAAQAVEVVDYHCRMNGIHGKRKAGIVKDFERHFNMVNDREETKRINKLINQAHQDDIARLTAGRQG